MHLCLPLGWAIDGACSSSKQQEKVRFDLCKFDKIQCMTDDAARVRLNNPDLLAAADMIPRVVVETFCSGSKLEWEWTGSVAGRRNRRKEGGNY